MTKIELELKISELESDNKDLNNIISLLKRENIDLKSKINSINNSVFLDGKQYPIIHRNTVKELVVDYYKKYVKEELTAVVIDKHGG